MSRIIRRESIVNRLNLIKCAECGHEISDEAIECVNCGYPIKTVNEQKNIDKTNV